MNISDSIHSLIAASNLIAGLIATPVSLGLHVIRALHLSIIVAAYVHLLGLCILGPL